MRKLKDFLTKNIAMPIEGLVNTTLSLVRDKTRDADTSFIREKITKGVSISSKRVLNLTGTAAIITVALFLIKKDGITENNLILIGIGAIYSIAMSFITAYIEK